MIRLGLTWFDQGRREGTMGIQPTPMNYIVIYIYILYCFHSCHSYGIYIHRHFAVGHHHGRIHETKAFASGIFAGYSCNTWNHVGYLMHHSGYPLVN